MSLHSNRRSWKVRKRRPDFTFTLIILVHGFIFALRRRSLPLLPVFSLCPLLRRRLLQTLHLPGLESVHILFGHMNSSVRCPQTVLFDVLSLLNLKRKATWLEKNAKATSPSEKAPLHSGLPIKSQIQKITLLQTSFLIVTQTWPLKTMLAYGNLKIYERNELGKSRWQKQFSTHLKFLWCPASIPEQAVRCNLISSQN